MPRGRGSVEGLRLWHFPRRQSRQHVIRSSSCSCHEGCTHIHVRSLSTETVRTERVSKNTANSLSHSLRVIVSLTVLASRHYADARPKNLVSSALLSRLFSPTSPGSFPRRPWRLKTNGWALCRMSPGSGLHPRGQSWVRARGAESAPHCPPLPLHPAQPGRRLPGPPPRRHHLCDRENGAPQTCPASPPIFCKKFLVKTITIIAKG